MARAGLCCLALAACAPATSFPWPELPPDAKTGVLVVDRSSEAVAPCPPVKLEALPFSIQDGAPVGVPAFNAPRDGSISLFLYRASSEALGLSAGQGSCPVPEGSAQGRPVEPALARFLAPVQRGQVEAWQVDDGRRLSGLWWSSERPLSACVAGGGCLSAPYVCEALCAEPKVPASPEPPRPLSFVARPLIAPCPRGQRADLAGQCVALGRACPTGPFATAPTGPVSYVDPSASASGDGSTPATAFRTVAEALAAAAPNSTVMLAKGSINESISVTTAVHLDGACVVGSTLAGTLSVEAPGVRISNLTLSAASPLHVAEQAALIASHVEIIGPVSSPGNLSASQVRLVSDGAPAITVTTGSVSISEGTIEGSANELLLALGSARLTLSDTRIRGPAATVEAALLHVMGARVSLHRVLIEQPPDDAILLEGGANAELQDVAILGRAEIQGLDQHKVTHGIRAQNSTLSAERTEIRNVTSGIRLGPPGQRPQCREAPDTKGAFAARAHIMDLSMIEVGSHAAADSCEYEGGMDISDFSQLQAQRVAMTGVEGNGLSIGRFQNGVMIDRSMVEIEDLSVEDVTGSGAYRGVGAMIDADAQVTVRRAVFSRVDGIAVFARHRAVLSLEDLRCTDSHGAALYANEQARIEANRVAVVAVGPALFPHDAAFEGRYPYDGYGLVTGRAEDNAPPRIDAQEVFVSGAALSATFGRAGRSLSIRNGHLEHSPVAICIEGVRPFEDLIGIQIQDVDTLSGTVDHNTNSCLPSPP